MFKKIMAIAVIMATLLIFASCGKVSKKEPHWTYEQRFEVNDYGVVTYSVHTFYSDDSEYARKMAEDYQDYYLDKGRTVTEVLEINEDTTYYQFKVVAE